MTRMHRPGRGSSEKCDRQAGGRRVTMEEVSLAEGFSGKERPEQVCRQWGVRSKGSQWRVKGREKEIWLL